MTFSPFETDVDLLEKQILQEFEGVSLSDIKRACELSREIHGDQRYSEPDEPYLPHTFRVPAYLVVDFGVIDKELVISALLHDSIEDQAERLASKGNQEDADPKVGARRSLQKLFGTRVADIVWMLSNPPIYYEAQTVEEKIKRYQENLSEELKDEAVFSIKLADLCDNWPTINDNVSPERRLYAARKYIDSFDKFLAGLDTNQYIASSSKDMIREYLLLGKRELGMALSRAAVER